MVTIKVRQNGPYRVEGDDVTVVDWNGVEYPIAKRPIALCRCAQLMVSPALCGRPWCRSAPARTSSDRRVVR